MGGGFKYLLFSPRNLGKWSNLINIFQTGWNHQLALNMKETWGSHRTWSGENLPGFCLCGSISIGELRSQAVIGGGGFSRALVKLIFWETYPQNLHGVVFGWPGPVFFVVLGAHSSWFWKSGWWPWRRSAKVVFPFFRIPIIRDLTYLMTGSFL